MKHKDCKYCWAASVLLSGYGICTLRPEINAAYVELEEDCDSCEDAEPIETETEKQKDQ